MSATKSYKDGEFTLRGPVTTAEANFFTSIGVLLMDPFFRAHEGHDTPDILRVAIDAVKAVIEEIRKEPDVRDTGRLVGEFNTLQNIVFLAEMVPTIRNLPANISEVMPPEAVRAAELLRNLAIGIMDPSQFPNPGLEEGDTLESYRQKVVQAHDGGNFATLNIAINDFSPK